MGSAGEGCVRVRGQSAASGRPACRRHRRLEHPNLLRMLGVSSSGGGISLVIELMPRGSIYTWLRRECRGVPPPLPLTLRLLAGTAAGMAYLHSRSPRVAHRDLKSLNLLLTSDLAVRIADFGTRPAPNPRNRHGRTPHAPPPEPTTSLWESHPTSHGEMGWRSAEHTCRRPPRGQGSRASSRRRVR